MKLNVLCIGVLVLFCASLEAATYYISPTGNNAAAGTAVSAPWKTFAYAIPKLKPGDVLNLLDGTYDASNSGWLRADSLKGSVASPITIRAANERRARIKGDGGAPVVVNKSDYIVVEGLYISNADVALGPTANFIISGSNHITAKRCLLAYSNRLVNNALLQLNQSKNLLVEENEFYNWTGLGVNFNSDDSCVIRRNYFNRRAYPVLNVNFAQETAIQVYPGRNNHNIIENNISETDWGNWGEGTIQPSQDNRFYGDISIGGNWGIGAKARDQYGQLPSYSPTNDIFKDIVSIGAGVGFSGRGANNTRVLNSSFLDNRDVGVASDVEFYSGHDIREAGIAVSFHAENVLVTGGKTVGFHITKQDVWGLDYVNSFNSPLNYYPTLPNANVTNALSIDPKLGTCKVWIPDNSPMKRAGKNGADIGANVLYRYQNGVLTSEPLWDPRTGEFPRGAIVPGINDIPGQSLFDVHKRLNVNCNSCPFPASYPKPGTPAITPARGINDASAVTLRPAGSGIAIQWNGQSKVNARIYSLDGKHLASFNDVGSQGAVWNPDKFSAGVYLVRVEAGNVTQTVKVFSGR